jgi:hypothetical protein
MEQNASLETTANKTAGERIGVDRRIKETWKNVYYGKSHLFILSPKRWSVGIAKTSRRKSSCENQIILGGVCV